MWFVSQIIANVLKYFKVENSKGTGIGTDDIYEPTLWYFDLMSFTAQSEIGRKGVSNDATDSEEVRGYVY